MPASFFSLFHQLEVVSESYFQADLGEVLEVVQAHVDIDCGFDADVVVQVEAVADFGAEVDVVDVRGDVLVLQQPCEVESVLLHVVAGTCAEPYAAVAVLVVPAELAEQHPAVGNEIACIGLQTDEEVGALAVAHAQACALQVGAYVLCAFFELCECSC